MSGEELLAAPAVFRQCLPDYFLLRIRALQAMPLGLANFQAVFGNLTGEDARPTLWRGRPRPRPELKLGASFQGTISLTARRTPAIPAGANRRLHTRAPEGRSENRPALQRRFRPILNRPRPGGSG